MYKILFDIIIVAALVFTGVYLYRTYGDDVRVLFSDDHAVIFVDNLALDVTIADTAEARQRGLSDTERLAELEGMLFIFDEAAYPRIWMKDMNYPIDIFFVDNDLTIIEIVENVQPETYPLTFTSRTPARFVLETNALIAKSFKIEVGDRLNIPPRHLPADLRESLRQ